jgi:hypothetical protein
MLRATSSYKNDGLAPELEGRLIGASRVQVKSLVSRHFVPNGLLVDLSKVTHVDSAGEQLRLWLRDSHAKFVTETCHACDICERLQLAVQRDTERFVPPLTEVHFPQTAPLPRPGVLP